MGNFSNNRFSRGDALLMFYIFFALCGCGLLIVGLWEWLSVVVNHKILTTFFEIDTDNKDLYRYIAYARVTAGAFCAVIVLVSILACIRVLHKQAVAILSLVLIMLIIGEVAATLISIKYMDESLEDWERTMQFNIKTYYGNTADQVGVQVTNDMDSIQRKYKCCGALNSGDFTTPGKAVPNSCCINNDCSQGTYTSGCVELAYEDEIWEELKIMIYVSIAQGVLEIVTLMLCCCLCRDDDTDSVLEPDSSKLGLAKAYDDSNLGHGRGYLVAQNQAQKTVAFQGVYPTPTASPPQSNLGGPTSVYVIPPSHTPPAPNDPIFYQDHMKRYDPHHPKYNKHHAASDLSSTGAVFQAQHGVPVSHNSTGNRESLEQSMLHNGGLLNQNGGLLNQNGGAVDQTGGMVDFDSTDPMHYDILSYQHHMKRFPPNME